MRPRRHVQDMGGQDIVSNIVANTLRPIHCGKTFRPARGPRADAARKALSMTSDSHDLEKVSRLTLEYYERRAAEFWEGTRDHDVSQNIAALLQFIEGPPPFTLLDFGCGPGQIGRASCRER